MSIKKITRLNSVIKSPKKLTLQEVANHLVEQADATSQPLVIIPCSFEKRPYLLGWSKLTSVDANEVKKWQDKYKELMLGLPAGQNGLCIIDLDIIKDPEKKTEPDGIAEFEELCEQYGYDFRQATLCAKSASGGIHVYYQMPTNHEIRNSTTLGKHIDVRGHGGYIIMPPSKSRAGQYEWLNDKPVAPMPLWLLTILQTKNLPKKESKQVTPCQSSTHGQYVNERERKAYQAALDNECESLANTSKGTRNSTLNTAACKLGHYIASGKLDENDVYNGLYEAAMQCGLEPKEIENTIQSGLKKGKQKPKEISPNGGSWEYKFKNEEQATDAQAKPADNTTPEHQQEALSNYQNAHCIYNQHDAFCAMANEAANMGAIPTGYANLDTLLDGGLYPGLYVIGAISSLGKTTFALQMADHIAMHGNDVLIFSIEMSSHELMAKTISRITYQHGNDNKWPACRMKTTRELLSGKWCMATESSRDVHEAMDLYDTWASHIYVIEGTSSDKALSVAKIKECVGTHIKLTGNKPVVIVDYLQIIEPCDFKYSDKQNMDKNIVALKQISRDKQLPLIAISSFNRDNYSTRANMSAFKESGIIEYSSDVLIALQLILSEIKGPDKNEETKKEIEKIMAEKTRPIELVILKNRNGKRGTCNFNYYPKYNCFME